MSSGLKKVLGPVQLWGIAVGLVISGEYFGWNTPLTLVFVVLMALAYGYFRLTAAQRQAAAHDDLLSTPI